MKKTLLFIIILLLTSSNTVFAKDPPPIPFLKGGCDIDKITSAPASFYNCMMHYILYHLFDMDEATRGKYNWGNVPSGPGLLLREVIIPFVALGVVTYGFLINIDIFGPENRWINIVLTILMVLSIFPTGLFEQYILTTVLEWGPRWAFGLWSVLFILGTFYVFKGARARMGSRAAVVQVKWDEIKQLKKELKNLNSQKGTLIKQYKGADTAKIEKLNDAITQIDKRLDEVQSRIEALEET